MSNELIPYSDIERMASVTAKSGLFGIKTSEQAAALMLIAQAEGLHPAIAARDYHIIQGRPSLKADAMLGRFQAAGGKVQFHEYTDKAVIATFTHPQGGTIKIDWTIERAIKAGLGNKDNWRQYPRQMLRARVISEGIRTIFPGCIGSFYTPEELQDISHVIDVTPQAAISAPEPQPIAPEPTLSGIEPLLLKLNEADSVASLRAIWNDLQPEYKQLDLASQERLRARKDELKSSLQKPITEAEGL